ncbi:alpha/beta hydrolase [Prochlorococcus sp. MIT 1223]|uniref:alpha/beta hydrolase n=1 Tax=Prochlorococcus sp. MIT 1223 TaxID=3096217 RepID=UPI002A752B77|nr:alpha/beta hydrolase [Prochlorococcus sp. MIT 1223]
MTINSFIYCEKVNCAENIIIYKGILSRSISVESLDHLAKTKKLKGSLKKIIKLTNQNKDEISDLLNQEYEAPLVLTSKLINSKIGSVILSRVAEIIYPNKVENKSISVPAIRAALINGIVKGNGRINLIQFLKSYPNKNIAINYSALSKVINKVESMNDLVEFFSGSPLDKLKNINSI